MSQPMPYPYRILAKDGSISTQSYRSQSDARAQMRMEQLEGEVILCLRTGSSSEEMPAVPGSSMAELERYAIEQTLASVDGSTNRAAAILGISARKIQYRVRGYREELRRNPVPADERAPSTPS